MAKFPTYEEIGKKVAEKALDEYIYKGKTLREWIDILGQTQWIPISERLPKKYEEVFVYLFRKQPYIAWHDGVDWCTNDFKVDKDDELLAWMPLPQPYKADKESD